MRAALEHHRVAGQQLSRTQEQLVSHRDQLGRHILDRPTHHPVGDARSRGLQLSHRVRGTPLGITLECLASGLHEDHDQTGKRLPRKRAVTMASMATRSAAKRPATDAAQGLPHHWCAGERQPRAPHGTHAQARRPLV